MVVRCSTILFLYICAGFCADLSLESARERADKGDWKGAEELSRRHLRDHPADEAATVLHATSMIRLSQPFDAALELEEILNLHPNFLEASKLYAALLMDVLNDSEGAGKILAHCSQLAPKDPQVWEALGKLNLRRKSQKHAMDNFREAARLAPTNPVYVAELAHSLEGSDDEAARATYR